MKRNRILAVGIGSVLAAAAVAAGPASTAASASAGAAAAPGIPGTPIKHVIEIMVENHTFDNLFGTFPGADGIPANTTLVNPGSSSSSAPDVHPVFATPNEGDVMNALTNGRNQEQMAMDYQPGKGYQMDHFTLLPQNSFASVTEFGPQFDPNQQYLAQHYELADHNFQPEIAPTQPNVMTALNGTSHGWYFNDTQPNDTQPWNSIFDELVKADRPWKIYYALPTDILNGTLWDKIVPSDELNNITTGDQFFSDLSGGNLPDFSFVRPGVGYSGEAEEDLGNPDAWIGQLVSAVANSKYWNSTAIFVTYDEGGGFWDHVAPPANGYGTRTPMTIISPYAKPGVYHQQTTNVSILSFMQKLWGLPPLTPLNAQQNDLMSAFDFSRAPLPAPAPPVAPPDTFGFHAPDGILTNIAEPAPGKPVSINLEAETPGLSLDSGVNGTVQLAYTPPPGVTAPTGNPTSVTLSGGQANFTLTFPQSGYYRVAATGPNGAEGWVTVDVGTTPATAPAQ
ncbi:MAG TPA: alkaline phosphatase family protein [Amycolatopsis sp.]|jgi:phospholipase C|nr:alkaline phosphatase family protein [Amycolatopsis sp.]